MPAVTCPADVRTNASGGVCLLPSISFAANVTGYPAPIVSYQLGTAVITSPMTFPLGTNTVGVTAPNIVGTNTCSFTVIVLPGAAPQMQVVQIGTNVVVSWPTNSSCYTLQFSTALASNVWQAYAGPRGTNAGSFLVTNSVSTANFFFRPAH